MTLTGQALRRGHDARATAREAAREALAQVEGARPDAVLVFATEGYDAHAVLAGVQEVTGEAPIAGGRAPGVFCDDMVTHDGVGVLILSGGDVHLACGVAEDASSHPRRAGARAAHHALGAAARTGGTHTVLAIVPDAIRANSVDVVRGVADEVGTALRLVGGGSGDDLHYRETFQFAGHRVVQDAVVAAALTSRAPAGIGLRHGCSAWGPPMRVTRCDGPVVQELEWQPAYQRYAGVVRALGLGDVTPAAFVSFALLHPFGIADDDGDYILRSPLELADNGAIRCCSDVPRHGVMRVMLGNRISLLDAATTAALDARRGLRGSAAAVGLVFACVSRDSVLRHADSERSEELRAVRRGLGPEVPLFGCLTLGQIGSPNATTPQCHSKSIQVCALPAAA